MTENKKKLTGFKKGILIYAAVLIVIFAVALGLLYGFVNAYEMSRPYNSMEKYLSGIDENALPPACEELIAELDTAIRPEDESRSFLKELISGAEFVKSIPECTDERLAYYLKSGDQPFATIYLEQQGKSSFGFSVWEVAEEKYDLSPFVHTASTELPEGYSLSLNGAALGEDYIKNSRVKYQTLLSCYEYYESLPYLVRYESGKYLGDAELKVFSPDGRELLPEEQNEYFYLNNCTAEQEKLYKDFSDEVIRRYVQLCANVDKNEVGNYNHMKELIIPQSQLHDRMRISFYALGYSSIRSSTVTSTELKVCCDLGGGKYFTDIHYSVETVGLAGPVVTEQNIQLVLSYDSLNQLKAEAMFNY